MSLNEELDLFLITYNRKEYLKRTFDKLFKNDSPIKNITLTVLDNASTDGTDLLIKEYAKKHPHLKSIRHQKNISGSGNLLYALFLVSKKYFWILCDDDDYDWTYWHEAEDGIRNNADCIITERNSSFEKCSLPVIANELSFLPAGIYKSENLTETVLQNALTNAYTNLPHLALVYSLINNHKKFYVPKHTIIRQGWELKGNTSYVRGTDTAEKTHFRLEKANLFVGTINSLQLLREKKVRYEIIETLALGKSFWHICNYILKNNFSFHNFYDTLCGISFSQKITFLTAFCFFLSPIQFSFSEKGITLKLFYKIKIRIFGYYWFKKKPY